MNENKLRIAWRFGVFLFIFAPCIACIHIFIYSIARRANTSDSGIESRFSWIINDNWNWTMMYETIKYKSQTEVLITFKNVELLLRNARTGTWGRGYRRRFPHIIMSMGQDSTRPLIRMSLLFDRTGVIPILFLVWKRKECNNLYFFLQMKIYIYRIDTHQTNHQFGQQGVDEVVGFSRI